MTKVYGLNGNVKWLMTIFVAIVITWLSASYNDVRSVPVLNEKVTRIEHDLKDLKSDVRECTQSVQRLTSAVVQFTQETRK